MTFFLRFSSFISLIRKLFVHGKEKVTTYDFPNWKNSKYAKANDSILVSAAKNIKALL